MIKVAINRAEWGRGALWDVDKGCGCVLGHCLRAAGVPVAVLDEHPLPYMLPSAPRAAQGMLSSHNRLSELASVALAVNDEIEPELALPPPVRESKLTDICRHMGFDVEWSGEYRS